ncbi:MAG: leucine--tRNA ligase [Candidatus Nealsonbacteria bacterium CG_4_10_14_0_2_um_filter_35_20]|uniref:Leucine--tRNA ligase n=1 Tax=Candidatus Nealsonbacteria bacterium CG02_land_8_20_14_3_00_34_20 TaxID=1974698 RepID=A0A2M7DBG2_9BACT|nr:MAG: leucine--tRNA ligase [Candidatus Nealsonbacteria bacterium CG02_land_8_20_14_3_00_34_20]PIW92460.1 MAG: leucine--tRNA ligase [Candidatus Nealsonbacteria bacterium CG_4_8_14_3_um_filter_34_13]PIZ89846.1 MAG: leucine--tRNA ligase [Candidatus Nealsonbacteria bacterium CG_4_10_14_0_2_um_filter_35_20]
MHYNPQKIESKWQQRWEKQGLYSPDLDKAEKPFYNLMMFPYPSAEGLHIGNMYAFVHSDAYGRYIRMKGFDVFEPIGLDGFGIHSENYALKIGEHISDVSKRTEKHFYQQLKMIGNQYDFKRTLETYQPQYYKWTQWIFIQMFKKGLAYQRESYVNWCSQCKTVLADEQVIGGYCERCGAQVEKKLTKQWFFKITDYAERLLKNLESLSTRALGSKVKISKEMAQSGIDWSEKTKIAQREWIGKSEGVEFEMEILDTDQKIKVFTTRLDTIFGMTYAILSPEHPIVTLLLKTQNSRQGRSSPKAARIQNREEVEEYIKEAKKETESVRTDITKEKTGVELKGIRVINPFNKQKTPLFIADFILGYYGTGAVMAVPAHDQRDYEFAKKYGLPIKEVIKNKNGKSSVEKKAFENYGVLINSGEYNGLTSYQAIEKMITFLKEKKIGDKKINYKLRDWCISRQRYWGPPIPIIYCEKCGTLPVPEKNLPVLLPEIEDFRPTGTDSPSQVSQGEIWEGKSPLASVKEFVNTICPKCGAPAKRETDVSDTFLDSAWYFFRYPSLDYQDRIFDKQRTQKWLPVDMYIGGQEHACLHLLYSRFITMFFKDLGLIDFEEPYKRFFAHGLLIKEGAKMSKSKGNIVNPDEYIKKYGADLTRMYLMFLGKISRGGDWQDSGMAGMTKFVRKAWNLFSDLKKDGKGILDLSFMHKTIKRVDNDLERLSFNTAIAKIMEYVNWYKENQDNFSKKERKLVLENLVLLLSPFTPHLSEELWEKIGHRESVFKEKWPEYDSELVKEEIITLIIQVNGKIRDKIDNIEADIFKEKAKELAISRQKIKKWLKGKEIKKTIFVPGKLINFVV